MDKNIEIYIDRIVLEGVDPLNKTALKAAIHAQLLAMISEQGLPDGMMKNAYHRKKEGGEMSLPNQIKIQQIGNDIADGIYRSFNTTK